jgi:putative ribosome biogenesis GTPase RsgA
LARGLFIVEASYALPALRKGAAESAISAANSAMLHGDEAGVETSDADVGAMIANSEKESVRPVTFNPTVSTFDVTSCQAPSFQWNILSREAPAASLGGIESVTDAPPQNAMYGVMS